MTDVNVGGRPRQFDEAKLVRRIQSLEDLALIRAALAEHSSRPTWARGCVGWLRELKTGDPSGGVSPRMASYYRKMLTELPHDPLRPPGGRRQVLRRLKSDAGSAQFALLAGGALAGAANLAAFGAHLPSPALRALALAVPPIILVMSSCVALRSPG